MTQYSMNSHVHLRHLRSSHILDQTLRSMRSPIRSTLDPIPSQILNHRWTLDRSSPYGPCLISGINPRELLVTEDSHATATFPLDDRKPWTVRWYIRIPKVVMVCAHLQTVYIVVSRDLGTLDLSSSF